MNSESKKKLKILLIIIIVLAVILVGVSYFVVNQKSQIKELQQETGLNKQQLQDEYENLSVQYEGFKLNISNDSLLEKLNGEQTKVQRLLEEVKAVKVQDHKQINHLNKELSGLRKILKSYVVEIDSLNQANQRLRKENKEIKTRYKRAARTLVEVAKQKKDLTQKVTLASKLDATNIVVIPANSRGKLQKRIKRIQQIIVKFTITKNITATPGEREIYVRIMRPDDKVLIKNRANLFHYENADINYSMKKLVEYAGEELNVTEYWSVEEYLMPGTYRADIFVDGNLIGSQSFSMH